MKEYSRLCLSIFIKCACVLITLHYSTTAIYTSQHPRFYPLVINKQITIYKHGEEEQSKNGVREIADKMNVNIDTSALNVTPCHEICRRSVLYCTNAFHIKVRKFNSVAIIQLPERPRTRVNNSLLCNFYFRFNKKDVDITHDAWRSLQLNMEISLYILTF